MVAIAEPEWVEGGGPFGESFRSYVPVSHRGPCAMLYSSGDQQHWAVFPSRDAALTAGEGACRRDVGGYSDVQIYSVSDAPINAKQYDSAIDWLFEGEDVWREPPEGSGAAAIVRRFMRELARRIAAHPRELAILEWRDLERLLFEVFDALGYNAILTRPAKDGGFDLRLEAGGLVYFVEVKHWSERSKVGAGIVDRFTEVVIAKGGEGLMVSTSGFTDDVFKGKLKISECPVYLGDDLKVISLCRYYVQVESGLWVPQHGLRELLFEGTI